MFFKASNTKNHIRHAVMLLCVLTLCCSIGTGCSSGEQFVDVDGNIIYFGLDELNSGIYIQFEDETHRRPLPLGMNFNGPSDEVDDTRMVWLRSDHEWLIPEVNGNDRFIYITDTSVPSKLYFEHFTETCYSFGALFPVNNDGSISFPSESDSICSGTAIDVAIDQMIDTARNTRIIELGTADDINAPFSSGLLSDMGYVTGLSANAMYKFGYYEGTKYDHFYVSADTHIFRQAGVYDTTIFTPTKNGYFIIELPDDLPSGLICINGVGLFNYTAGLAPAISSSNPDDDAVIPTSTLPPEEVPIEDTIGSSTVPSTPAPVVQPTPSAPTMLEPAAEPVPGSSALDAISPLN